MKKVASLRYGVIFKKAFSQPDIFKAFVKDFIGIDLKINKVEMEKQFYPVIGKVDTRFDLFAEDISNRVIVDIQHARYGDHYDRFLHYHNVALLEQVASSENYHPNLRVFTIVVLTSGDKHKVDMATTDFAPKDNKGVPLNELRHKIIFLSPKYVTDDTPEPYREWLLAIADSLDEEVDETSYQHKEIRQIFDLIEQDLVSPQERFKMKDEYCMEQLQQDKVLETVQKIARNLLAEGIKPAIVAKTTGISADELADIQFFNS
ncbi:PD-(D/E)XK nuclease family transposase [Candidatus Marithioploca araucensis]|uniref:PD-(D/E)XK nuclease family transposase n=1 Tax=Candidatus Marithioploca araucensis TaxID=70273 RepID=A0ABT7VU43_9GAMM|nr:PD-(D/E)XK nuclease family transposase [Candidatus Marithioploca araucensis]